ncbi:hypothetical protein [Rhodococcus artemisiae]|uniref:HEPN domain-containing protein n=1 Tax=Rhodococcus artemisiae TaxID=714159 RepID=A0ABU7L4Y4_9NOCA|nr:hypothetical protein [Rhodococcus artemisiae]MEE2056601.1 hypothetical protein [Rhodococcus artemisiae]
MDDDDFLALAAEMDAFTERHRWGLAESWRLAKSGDIDAARKQFEATRRFVEWLRS